MPGAALSALPYSLIVNFSFKNQNYVVLGCSDKLQTFHLSSLAKFNASKNGCCLDASSKNELSVSHRLPSVVKGIVPLPKIGLLVAYGESYLAIFSIAKLLISGHLCQANTVQLSSPITAVHAIKFNMVRILFKSGLIQDVNCEIGEKIQFTPCRSTRFPSDFNVKSLSFDDGNYIAYNADEQTLSTVVFNPIGPITTQLAKFSTVLKRYFLLRYRLINDRYLFVLDSMGILTIQDCSIDKRLFIEGICITSFEIFGRDNEILLLLGDATGYVHLYSVLLNPLQMMSKEWKFMISTAKISLMRVFPADEGSILVCGDFMGHLASMHIPSLRKFNNIVPKTILTIPKKWNATSIYSLREIPTAENKVTECIMLDTKLNLSTFGITDTHEFVLEDKKAVEIKKIKKTIFKTFTTIIGYGDYHWNVRIIDNNTQSTMDTLLSESTCNEKILGFFYLSLNTYVIQFPRYLEFYTVVKTVGEKSGNTEMLSTCFVTDDIVFSHVVAIQTKNPQQSNCSALLGISCVKRQKWTSSFYGSLTPFPGEKCSMKSLTKLPGRVVDCNSFANGEVYVLLTPPMLIRFDILHVEEEPNVKLIATGRWSLRGIFGKVYRLLPCPGYENSDILVTGTRQFSTATGLTEDDLEECLKTRSFRQRHETEVIVWQVHEWREWGRSVLPSRTKSWDVDVDFDRTSLRINTVSKMNGSGQRDFKYEQFRRPELLQCSAPVSLRATSKMKVLATADGKCPLKGAAICILTGDHRGLVSVLALIDKIWMIKASFQIQGEVTAFGVVFHPNLGFTISCGSSKSSDPLFFSVLLSDMGKGNVRFYNRNERTLFANSYQSIPIPWLHLPSHAHFDRANWSYAISNLSISWSGQCIATKWFNDTKSLTAVCDIYKDDTSCYRYLSLDDTGVISPKNVYSFNDVEEEDKLRSSKDKAWNSGFYYMNTQKFQLPFSSEVFSIIAGGFDGTVAYYFYCDEKQKYLTGAVDKLHTDSVVDAFCTMDTSSNDRKFIFIFSLDTSGIVVFRKLKLTATRVLSHSKPIRLRSSVKKASGLVYIPYERRILVIGEGFDLIPLC